MGVCNCGNCKCKNNEKGVVNHRTIQAASHPLVSHRCASGKCGIPVTTKTSSKHGVKRLKVDSLIPRPKADVFNHRTTS